VYVGVDLEDAACFDVENCSGLSVSTTQDLDEACIHLKGSKEFV
jgi:hypothetical protein